MFPIPEWRRRVQITHLRTERTLKSLRVQLKALEATLDEYRMISPATETDDDEPES